MAKTQKGEIFALLFYYFVSIQSLDLCPPAGEHN